MRRARIALQLIVVLTAAVLAAAPPPAAAVERYYSDWLYPRLQSRLTAWGNQTAWALFDVILIILVTVLLVLIWRTVRRTVKERSMRRLLNGIGTVATFLAGVYVWFALVWGLNYSRVPIESAVSYQQDRVTPEAVRALAARALANTNDGYAAGHAHGFAAIGEVPSSLVAAFHQVERQLGRAGQTMPGRPKRTLLSPFFRASGTDGMHAPFVLETLLNPDLTAPERPAVLAHEWAHLAGYAPEDDASFVGTLAALRADPGSRYSAWLSLLFESVSQLPRDERNQLLGKLAEGPRRDQQAIIERLKSRVDMVQRVSWQTYDQYLKAQGVREGIQSYSRVVQLLVASDAIDRIAFKDVQGQP